MAENVDEIRVSKVKMGGYMHQKRGRFIRTHQTMFENEF